jgi:uncharacterized membrane protein
MRTPASIASHPIHPMLVPIPIGLWVFSLICYLVYLGGATSESWRIVAFYTMVGGVLGAGIAAVPGVIDMLSLTGSRKRTALIHMSINLVIVVVYLVNIGMRLGEPANVMTPVWLSIAAVALLGVSGWLGGKMVYKQAVGVDTGEPEVRAEAQARKDSAGGRLTSH